MSKVVDGYWPEDGVQLVWADELDSLPIEWLMQDWIPEAELVVLGGDGGAGKTQLAMDCVATVSNGGTRRGVFPDGTPAPWGRSLIWTCEDDWERILRPRLVAARANLKDVIFVGDVGEFSSYRNFDFNRDLPGLIRKMEQIGDVKLLVIDTVMEVVSGGGTNAKKVREDLRKLVEIAHKYGITVLGIAHLVKGAKNGDLVKSLAGSQAIGNLARMVLIATLVKVPSQNKDSPSLGVLTRAKTNLGKSGDGLLYEIQPACVRSRDGREVDTSRIVWYDKVLHGSAEEIYRWAKSEKDEMAASPPNRAQEFLMRVLVDGPVTVSDINGRAEDEGITPKMLRGAKEKLGVISIRTTSNERAWSLPETDQAVDASSQSYVDPGHSGHAGHAGQVGQVGQVEERRRRRAYEVGDRAALSELFNGYMTGKGGFQS